MSTLAKYKYTKHTSKLESILRDAPRIGPPKEVSIAWLQSGYGITNNEASIIRVLRFVGLIRPDGTPTGLWETIRRPTPSNKTRFANAVRVAYDDLFTHYPDAHRQDDVTLRAFFQRQEPGGPEKQGAILRTFKTLVRFGDFDSDPRSSAINAIELAELVRSVEVLDHDVHEWLKGHNEPRARMEALYPMHMRLHELSLQDNEALRDGILAAEAGLLAASHVLAWTGFTDILYRPFTIDNIVTRDPRWKPKTMEELRRGADSRIIDSGKKLGFYDEGTRKTLQGMASDRNRCAHGSGHDPDLNETLLFLKKIFDMIEYLQGKLRGHWA
jgi:hypothetical protein